MCRDKKKQTMVPLYGSLTSLHLANALLSNKTTRGGFGGIVARDILCQIDKKPQYVVCNTDILSGQGEHWVVFYFPADGSVEMFDSLGKNISEYPSEFGAFVNKFASRCTLSHKRIQPPHTSLCGHYCLYYIMFRCRGVSMKFIVDFVPSSGNIAKVVQDLFIS